MTKVNHSPDDAEPAGPEASQSEDEKTSASEDTAHKHEDCEPAHGVRFAFGPRNYCFVYTKINDSSIWQSWRSQKSTSPNIGYDVGSVAMTADDGLFVTCSSKSSDEPVSSTLYSGPLGIASAYELAYQQLWGQIHNGVNVKNLSKTILSLGPQGSYYCRNGHGVLQRDIPNSLSRKLKTSDRDPVQVALGRKGSWVCVWPDHTFSYELGSEYPDLASTLFTMKSDGEGVAFIALNPYENGGWFIVGCDGFWRWSFKNFKQGQRDDIRKMAYDWMQKHVRKTGGIFTNVSTSGNDVRQVTIGPDTHHDKPVSKASLIQPAALKSSMTALLPERMQSTQRIVSQFYGHKSLFPATVAGVAAAYISKTCGMPLWRATAAGAFTGILTFSAMSFRD